VKAWALQAVAAKKAAVATAAQQPPPVRQRLPHNVKRLRAHLHAVALTTWMTTSPFKDAMSRLALSAEAKEQPVDLRSTGFDVIGLLIN
jgi:hypothetical protein